MIRHDPDLNLVHMDLTDLEHAGFDHEAFCEDLALVGVESTAARWPLALIVNFAGGQVVGADTEGETLRCRRVAQMTFNLWLELWRASSPEHCVWCGRKIVQHLPPQSTDTPHVGCHDRVICHVCVKHLAAIVLDQEHRLAHAARRAVDCEYCARGVPLSGSSPTMHDTGSALAPCTVLEIEAG